MGTPVYLNGSDCKCNSGPPYYLSGHHGPASGGCNRTSNHVKPREDSKSEESAPYKDPEDDCIYCLTAHITSLCVII